jgi:transposase
MRKYQIPRIQTKEFNVMIKFLKTLPDYKRNIAEKKLKLIQAYEATAKKEIRWMGNKFRKGKSIENFCDKNNVNVRTFYGYITQYEKQGLEGIIPHGWGHNKGSSEYDVFLPIVRKILSPGNLRAIDVYRGVVKYCDAQVLEYPSQAGIRRLIKRHALIQNTPTKKKEVKIKTIKKKAPKKPNLFKLTPDYIKIIDKKAFNIAMYKYGLVFPFLSPDVPKQDKFKRINEITSREHHPLPGVMFKIKPSTFYKYIRSVKRNGVDGLIPEHCFRKEKKHKNQTKAKITINHDKPWECIGQLENVIEQLQTDFKKEQQITLDLLRKVSMYSCRYMHKPVFLGIDIETNVLDELRELRINTHRNISTKATAILMAHNHHSLCDISFETNHPIRTVEGWLTRFKKRGIPYIKGKKDLTMQNIERRNRENRIVSILHQSPNDFGINRSAWILGDIARIYHQKYGVQFSPATIKRAIKKTNYTWKRARRVLTSQDPKYKEKTKKVLNALWNLGPNDAFFFVDEAGPWQVKKYGGKSLTLKGTVKIVPQFQAAKGRVSFIGALDAHRNQVTYIFIKSKNTMAVISLIKILYYKHQKYSTLNLTWDCASWHKSKQLQEFLAEFNKKETGPVINIVPLPKRAQFLNVIEAIFGGLKKAVVVNSNYQSEYEMKMAISRHFQERNEFYRKNPKRAGKKIWDRESFDLGDFEGGVYKKQM